MTSSQVFETPCNVYSRRGYEVRIFKEHSIGRVVGTRNPHVLCMVLSLQASFPKNTWRSTRYSIKPCTENCLTSNRVTGQEQPEKDIRTSNKLGKDADSEVHPIKKLQASNFGQHIFAVPVLCGQIPRLDQYLQCSDFGSQEI